MYKFSSKSNRVLGVLTMLAILGLFAVENNKVEVKQKWYNQKLKAAQLASTASQQLKEYRYEKSIFIDPINDPNETALMGQEYTLITTDRGDLEAKLTSTNPNFAAIVVDLLKEANLKKGDHVAVAYTGSFPGLNISVLSAIEILQLEPIIITSVGSSNWGANDPNFTWLDMEKILYEKKIFKNRSIAASMGGGKDRGRGLSPEGRKLIRESIKRNEIEFIDEDYLEKNIERRLEIYNKKDIRKIKAYINVGGGIASLGAAINGKIIRSGLTEKLPMKNFPLRGVLIKMAEQGVPIIHLLNIRQLANKYGLSISPTPLPTPGTGQIFVQLKYDVILVLIITLFLLGLIVIVIIHDRKIHRLGTENILLSKHN